MYPFSMESSVSSTSLMSSSKVARGCPSEADATVRAEKAASLILRSAAEIPRAKCSMSFTVGASAAAAATAAAAAAAAFAAVALALRRARVGFGGYCQPGGGLGCFSSRVAAARHFCA